MSQLQSEELPLQGWFALRNWLDQNLVRKFSSRLGLTKNSKTDGEGTDIVSRTLFIDPAFIVLMTLTFVAGCGRQETPPDTVTSSGVSADPVVIAPTAPEISQEVIRDYASVNGLRMYYEIHGMGTPLVLLHGSFGTATVYPALAANRRIIAVELQGHGHTADIDRPLTPEQLADDVAALLDHLQISQTDIFGYSMGGIVGLGVAIRHPTLVRKLAVYGSNSGSMETTYDPAAIAQFKSMSSDFAPPVLKGPYDKVAPDPSQWPALVQKIQTMGLEWKGFTPEEVQTIQAEVLIAAGDRDVVRAEHAVEMLRMIPNSQLAVFPGADHFLIWQNPDKMFPTIVAFLNAPVLRRM